MPLVRRRHIISRINAAHTETRVVDTFHNLAQVSWERIWSFKQRFSYLLWYFVSKIVLIYCEKFFFRDSNLFGQSKVRTILFYFVNGDSNQIWYIGTIEMPIWTNNWEVETYRNKLEKLGFSWSLGSSHILFCWLKNIFTKLKLIEILN